MYNTDNILLTQKLKHAVPNNETSSVSIAPLPRHHSRGSDVMAEGQRADGLGHPGSHGAPRATDAGRATTGWRRLGRRRRKVLLHQGLDLSGGRG